MAVAAASAVRSHLTKVRARPLSAGRRLGRQPGEAPSARAPAAATAYLTSCWNRPYSPAARHLVHTCNNQRVVTPRTRAGPGVDTPRRLASTVAASYGSAPTIGAGLVAHDAFPDPEAVVTLHTYTPEEAGGGGRPGADGEREPMGDVAVITLNRARQRNALSVEVLRELLRAVQTVAVDARVSAVVLQAAGTVFSSGHDLKEMSSFSSKDKEAAFRQLSGVLLAIKSMPQPVVAKVHAHAAAAGCQIVAACDLAVASSDSAFSTPGINVGLFCSTPGVSLSRSMTNPKLLMRMLTTGEPITAEQALAHGLVGEVVAPEDLDRATHTLASTIASKSRTSISMGKAAFYKQREMGSVSDAYVFASGVMSANLDTDDGREGVSAFLEKRHPQWPSLKWDLK